MHINTNDDDESGCDENTLWRGQSDETKCLLPKIAKLNTKKDVLTVEKKIFNDFKNRCVSHVADNGFSDIDYLALGQHWGLPTRLLDWSLNPLVALWFAVSKSIEQKDWGIVWSLSYLENDIYDPQKHSIFDTRTRIHFPRAIDNRIISQSAAFTIQAYSKSKHAFIPLDYNRIYKTKLTAFCIPKNSFSTIRFELDQLGVNASFIYPDLYGVCKNLEWKNSFLEDE